MTKWHDKYYFGEVMDDLVAHKEVVCPFPLPLSPSTPFLLPLLFHFSQPRKKRDGKVD